MTQDELRGCPFCGSEVKSKTEQVGSVADGLLKRTVYTCTNQYCGATVRFFNPLAMRSPDRTDVFWNRRSKEE